MSLVLWLLGTVHAGDLEFGYVPSPGPQEKPALLVTPSRALERLFVECDVGPERHRFDRRDLPGSVQQRFEWPRDTAYTHADCLVHAVFADGAEESLELPLDYSYGGGLSVDMDTASADLDEHTLSIDVTAMVERAEIVAYGARRVELDRRVIPLGEGPGRITLPWVGDPGEVVLLEVTLHSGNAYVSFPFSPWLLQIPHQDVLFETDSAVIPADEEWKLNHSLEALAEVVEQYGDIVPVKLYIGGCTDTVGNSAHNRDLSQRRARAIAAWLRSHGYDMPIFYRGFGEDWLATATADGVDESTNRRAVYMVGAGPPPLSSGVPSGRWRPL